MVTRSASPRNGRTAAENHAYAAIARASVSREQELRSAAAMLQGRRDAARRRVLVPHDPGCKWGRFEGTVDERANIISGEVKPGHSDAAKRFSDMYNLHKAAGTVRGWIAVRYLDGSSDGTVYDSRSDAVTDCFPWDDQFFYATLQAPSMTVCAAESVLRYKRIMSDIDRSHTDRDAPHGGLEAIPRLAAEDQEAQIEAVRSGKGIIALGYKKG